MIQVLGGQPQLRHSRAGGNPGVGQEVGELVFEQPRVDEVKTETKSEKSPTIVVPSPAQPPFSEITNNIGMKLILIPAGEFFMGSENGGDDEKPVRRVIITKPFYLGKYSVTQAQWEAVMGSNPNRFKGDLNRPVENVSWNGVQEFLRKLGAREEGKTYRLPTEAEWEYACRAGSTGAYCFGDDETKLKEYAWYDENSGNTTHPVGQLKSNDWGLYDMHGNVWEWVQDRYAEDYYKQQPNRDCDPKGVDGSRFRAIRGGSWLVEAKRVRVASRRGFEPDMIFHDVGFRCVWQFVVPGDRVLGAGMSVGLGVGLG